MKNEGTKKNPMETQTQNQPQTPKVTTDIAPQFKVQCTEKNVDVHTGKMTSEIEAWWREYAEYKFNGGWL